MPITRATLRILPEEYESFVRAIPNNPRLPASYYDWLKLQKLEDANYIAQGDVLKEVFVHFQQFTDYCIATEQEPNHFVLDELMFAKADSQR
jgi:hypothetical protein